MERTRDHLHEFVVGHDRVERTEGRHHINHDEAFHSGAQDHRRLDRAAHGVAAQPGGDGERRQREHAGTAHMDRDAVDGHVDDHELQREHDESRKARAKDVSAGPVNRTDIGVNFLGSLEHMFG
ncbi:MAG: hypothetical protein U0U69_10985 [Acidimicrobiia bacterium]